MSYFDPVSAAARYATGRPYFQPLVMARLQRGLGREEPVDLALDVGCGTGSSTVALRSLAERVIGIDRSAAMLAHAPRQPRLHYLLADAGALPIAAERVGIVTTSMAFHWFDRAPFLAESRRVLRPGGTLAIYNLAFAGAMRENRDFADWFKLRYLELYPVPPRDRAPFAAREAAAAGFGWLWEEPIETSFRYDLMGAVDYLVTQSNVIARVEGGEQGIGAVRHWLRLEMAPLFAGLEQATFPYQGRLLVLRRPPA